MRSSWTLTPRRAQSHWSVPRQYTVRVLAQLRKPSWIALGLVVAAATALFVNLGFWQLDRLEQRRAVNTVIAQRLAAAPVALEVAVDPGASTADAGEEHAFRPVTVSGVFDPANEVLVRSQVHDGTAGFHVITPLVTGDGRAILVNRGWVPLAFDTPPVDVPPTPGVVTRELTLAASRPRGTVGPEDEPGSRVISRVDLDLLANHMPYDLWPVYGLSLDGSELPEPVQLPELTEGTHRSYAIQWFAFAAISIIGYAALLRSSVRKPAGTD